jgi:hypothetical protein
MSLRHALRPSLFVAVLGLLPTAGCDLLSLLEPPDEDTPTPTRPRRDDGEEGEGEGEGEGEPDLPPDTPPHPLGPRVQSFTASLSTLSDDDNATLIVVVSDPDGIDDIVGALILEPVSGATLGTLSSAGAPGTFTSIVSWNTWEDVAPIEFVRGTVQRFIRVQFSDLDGHEVTSTLAFTMTCGNAPACNSQCGAVRCLANDNQCVSTEGNPISDAQLCNICNAGCQACTTGCACFDESPRCSGGNDCIVSIDGEGEVTQMQCTANAGLSLRDDGFVVWNVGGRDLPTSFNRPFSLPSGINSSQIFQELCEPFGGLSDDNREALPAELDNGQAVLNVEAGCTAANLAACEPVLGSADEVDGQGHKLTCVNPIGEPVGPNLGKFGQACRANDTCDGDMDCNGSNICVEVCFDDFDCDSCSFDTGGSGCTCNTGTGLCQVGGGSDFTCAGTRNLTGTTVTNQAGTTSGGATVGPTFCDGVGRMQSWRFTPSQTGTYIIRSGGHDTVLAVHADCDATTSLDCDDDGATDGVNNSQVTVSLTANVPVLVTVRTFSAGGAPYTLSIARQ